MAKIVTTSSLVEDYIAIYGTEDFDYSKVRYVNAKTEVLIHCNLCDITYPQIPRVHKRSRGCKGCRAKIIREKLGASQDDYITFCKNKFGSKWDYSLVEYTSAHEPIKIKCNTCNLFSTPTAHKHKNGKGKCKHCSTTDLKSFINNSKDIHKVGLYTYEKFEYTGYHKESLIMCHNCNEYFPQTPSSHLRGHGCKNCNSHYLHGIDAYKNRSATLYYFKVGNFYKIGITVENVKRRYANDPARKLFENINEWFFEDGTEAYKLEKYFINTFSQYKADTNILRGGNNELFTKDILKDILSHLDSSI